ncbi:MAG: chloride channel protein [Burkholderiales bacterium]|nr:chloride channel protein [Burkholderiales bacterium]
MVSLLLSLKKIVVGPGGPLPGCLIGVARARPQGSAPWRDAAGAPPAVAGLDDRHPRPAGRAGAVAGIAAVFNTPLGGVIFAIAAARGGAASRTRWSSWSIKKAGLVAAPLLAGNPTYFGELCAAARSVAVGAGAGGGARLRARRRAVLAKPIVASFRGLPGSLLCAWRARHPFKFAAAACAGGGGDRHRQRSGHRRRAGYAADPRPALKVRGGSDARPAHAAFCATGRLGGPGCGRRVGVLPCRSGFKRFTDVALVGGNQRRGGDPADRLRYGRLSPRRQGAR